MLLSVMEKLPPTSYVRMVDIWLISSQLVPFIEVLIVTMKEYFNESENINHHGMHVRVIDKTMLMKTKLNRIVILG